MKKINTTYLIALSALVFASCSESDGLSSGIPLSKEKIAFAATLQDGWNGGTSAEAGNNSRAGKPTFSGLAMEQKVLTANEGLAKPLYLHPLETENTTVMNAMPQTRGVMNESSTVGSFGVSAVYSKDGVNSSLFQNEEATQNGNYWFTSSNATWPLDGSVSFYAYAPNKDTSLSLQGRDDVMKNKTIHYTANTDDFSKQPDLIVAKNENNVFTTSTANKAVGLSFNHALTAITFSISADMTPGTVKSIMVSGVYGQGDYDFSTEKWIHLANPSTYVIKLDASVNAGESKALTDKNSALMMIPQDLDANANAKVSMVFNDGNKDKTVSFSLNGTWDAGKHITYVLSSSKITTLNMGSLTYPSGWNSVNTGANAKNQIRTAYASTTSAGLFVVNEDRKIIAANVQLTYNGTSWSLPAGSKLKFSPKYNYFVYYPYQDQTSLAGLPVVNTTVSEVSSSTQFFASTIATWKIAADQSTLEKMNACDLQIGKASLDEDGCSVSFKMEHAMGLAEITREEKAIPHLYKLSIDEKYTWTNGETSTTASSSLKDGKVLYNITSTKGLFVISPSTPTIFNSSSTGDDAWKDAVTIMSAADNVSSNIAYLNTYLDKGTYKMDVGDIYYSDGAITKPEDISTARSNGKTPIGVIGYIGNNKWTESGTGSGYGGHALVMCLKNIGSTSATDMGSNYQWYSSDTDCGRFKVNTGDLVRSSSDKDYGSGYIETNAIIEKWNSAAEAAYYAKNYQTLPANPTKCTGWFLPTAGQYYAVMSQLGGGINPDTWNIRDFSVNSKTVTGKINTALSKAGNNNYTQFFQILTWAWTSSEYSITTAVRIDSGKDNNKGAGSFRFDDETYGKSYKRPVRPFLAF